MKLALQTVGALALVAGGAFWLFTLAIIHSDSEIVLLACCLPIAGLACLADALSWWWYCRRITLRNKEIPLGILLPEERREDLGGDFNEKRYRRGLDRAIVDAFSREPSIWILVGSLLVMMLSLFALCTYGIKSESQQTPKEWPLLAIDFMLIGLIAFSLSWPSRGSCWIKR